MSEYYNAKRTRNLYDPKSSSPFKLSRTKVELFVNCPRCFYIDRRLGTGRPPGYPFALNSAVDTLLKKEFDSYREKQKPHPLITKNGIDAIPFKHEKMEEWRDSLHKGIQFHDKKTNLIITGGVDDIWITPSDELIIVDYKATSKKEAVSLDADWQLSYKRQMDLYGWLFLQNGFKIYPKGYFVYCNGKADKQKFDQKLEFDISVLPYEINYSWVEPAIRNAHKCLESDKIPDVTNDCDYCQYINAINETDNEK
ncbi:MAG: PD-(D/E)XK nuclease family protein [Xanthomonadaceae bacterium]|nr:PD-(D/E)XK nuclease family protein [Xanthomonadaceae bacterium]